MQRKTDQTKLISVILCVDKGGIDSNTSDFMNKTFEIVLDIICKIIQYLHVR